MVDFACKVFVCSICLVGVIVEVVYLYPVDRCFISILTVTSVVVDRFIYTINFELCNSKLGNVGSAAVDVNSVGSNRNTTERVFTVCTCNNICHFLAVDICYGFTIGGY